MIIGAIDGETDVRAFRIKPQQQVDEIKLNIT